MKLKYKVTKNIQKIHKLPKYSNYGKLQKLLNLNLFLCRHFSFKLDFLFKEVFGPLGEWRVSLISRDCSI